MVYYSLKPTTVSKEVVVENIGKPIYIEKHEENKPEIVVEPIQTYDLKDSLIKISANVPITLQTEEGYFKSSNKNIKVQKRTEDTIIFSIPYGVKEVTVEVQEKGDIVERTYRVV